MYTRGQLLGLQTPVHLLHGDSIDHVMVSGRAKDKVCVMVTTTGTDWSRSSNCRLLSLYAKQARKFL